MTSHHSPTYTSAHRPGWLSRVFIWLSGAGQETLAQCPTWEQRKHVAFGATVLVPTIFGMIAAGYALSTLTDDWRIIAPIAAVWGLIIMTIDRALLSIYRAYQSFTRKVGQFFLRIIVAGLMGVTISHPLTLLLFQDTIAGIVEQDRDAEIAALRASASIEKAGVETRISALEEDIAAQRTSFDETFTASFIVEDLSVGATDPTSQLDPELRAELENRIESDTADLNSEIAEIDTSIESLQASYLKIQTELDEWQREFEREVNGQRSGIRGLGPRAKSIQSDQLAWRRDEAARLGEMLEYETNRRQDLVDQIALITAAVQAEYIAMAESKAERLVAERERVAALKRQVQESQAVQFVDQQNAIRDTIAAQIDTRLVELGRLQGELASLGEQEQSRVAAIQAEPRRDILTQTLALHGLFEEDTEGGHFALLAYLILAALFMLVDTIPLIVKFFAPAGPYDMLVNREEVQFAREREAWMQSYDHYMNELSDGRMLHLTQNQPLEAALIDGVDRSRAAKAFVENLIDLEAAFEDRVETEKASLAKEKTERSQDRSRRLEQFATTFYKDLDQRMESFFGDDAVRKRAVAT